MASVQRQVQSADGVICRSIANLDDDRRLPSQTVLAQLRNLVEGLIVWSHLADPSAEFHYDQVNPALDEVKAKAKFRLLSRFHHLLQASTSHYTLDKDPSERLVLKYYEYLLRTRDLALKQVRRRDPAQSRVVPDGSGWWGWLRLGQRVPAAPAKRSRQRLHRRLGPRAGGEQ